MQIQELKIKARYYDLGLLKEEKFIYGNSINNTAQRRQERVSRIGTEAVGGLIPVKDDN